MNLKEKLLDFMKKYNFHYLHLSYLIYDDLESKNLFNNNKNEWIILTNEEKYLFDNLKHLKETEFNDYYFREKKVKEIIDKNKKHKK